MPESGFMGNLIGVPVNDIIIDSFQSSASSTLGTRKEIWRLHIQPLVIFPFKTSR